MKTWKSVLVTLSLSSGFCVTAPIWAQLSMPPGIGTRLTIEGPIFVDAKGMALYKVNKKSVPSIESCDNRRNTVLLQTTLEGRVDFDVSAPNIETRRSCTQKRPPLLAPENARPIGKWSIRLREDGSKQWAYDGELLYTSIKDKAPGEINGSFDQQRYPYPWTIASAPLLGAPTGIAVKKTVVGLALTNPTGQTFYYPDRETDAAQSRLWQPVTVPMLATAARLSDWSIVTRFDGLRQWAYKGMPLYRYMHDSDSDASRNRIFADIFGGTYGRRVAGWHVALVKEAPSHPAEVTIHTVIETFFEGERSTSMKMIYTDAKGMTLYTIHCVEDTSDRLECDDVGDSPSYWLSFCGGEERCAKTWRPFLAPADAKSIDATWTVISINPHHPWRATDRGSNGLSVWAYEGRPVFTYAHDLRQGDMNGAVPFDIVQGMGAETLTAYGKSSNQ